MLISTEFSGMKFLTFWGLVLTALTFIFFSIDHIRYLVRKKRMDTVEEYLNIDKKISKHQIFTLEKCCYMLFC
jgi:hypothetical protein